MNAAGLYVEDDSVDDRHLIRGDQVGIRESYTLCGVTVDHVARETDRELCSAGLKHRLEHGFSVSGVCEGCAAVLRDECPEVESGPVDDARNSRREVSTRVE